MKKIMNKTKQTEIEVFADWSGLPQPTKIGILCARPSRGKEIFSFEYSKDWLQHPHSHALDLSLQLFQGSHYAPTRKENFGVFLDSSPDHWGRFLMKRIEAQLAREEKREERNLLESDYLLGVYDQHGMGALRFSTDSKGPFLDDNKKLWIAKFPSGNDEYDIGAWEMVIYKLAKQAKIHVADAKIGKFNKPHQTFISKRFDKAITGEPIHFLPQ